MKLRKTLGVMLPATSLMNSVAEYTPSSLLASGSFVLKLRSFLDSTKRTWLGVTVWVVPGSTVLNGHWTETAMVVPARSSCERMSGEKVSDTKSWLEESVGIVERFTEERLPGLVATRNRGSMGLDFRCRMIEV